MKTHEVEEMLGITKQSLIYYEKEGLIHPLRQENNYRDYTQKDIDLLKLILLLRSMEVTIDEIKLILNNQLSIRNVLEQKKDFIHDSQKS
ncbi:MerR family transcriptional regulator [Allocoprobacillus halotolerans]|uniref:MerR family transcriptional regulator n=1 Tax=Allocoprobacillus halotolerans TaxID=2944914 RepID=A0ABY5I044_9FIRM|nr:MerR family transcriptional regulator [Allocoprobacillus halotolerans]UTY38420.1 MerR family transcriptional regulator [Allocoprobacillus halotolerans]